MATQFLRGTLDAQIQNESWHWDPARGQMHYGDYHGVDQPTMLALGNAMVALGWTVTLKNTQGGNARIEFEDPTLSYLIDCWQIVANEESRDGLSHPGLAAGMVAVGATDVSAQIADMRSALEQNLGTTDAFATGQPLHGAPDIVKAFYELQVRGSKEYRRGQYVLRHSTNAPNRWGANISDNGIDCIYSTAELLSETQNGALWYFPLPGRLAYKIGAIPVPTYQTGYLWGWLKAASTETTSANNRIEITTEYTLEQWSMGPNGYYLPY